MMSEKQRQGKLVADGLSWRDRLKREQREQREAQARAAAPARMRPLAESKDKVLAVLQRLEAKAENFNFACPKCRDIGLILEDKPDSNTGGTYLASYPCRDCRKGLAKCDTWTREGWNRAKKKGAASAPEPPKWFTD
jgi:hypothetical protein